MRQMYTPRTVQLMVQWLVHVIGMENLNYSAWRSGLHKNVTESGHAIRPGSSIPGKRNDGSGGSCVRTWWLQHLKTRRCSWSTFLTSYRRGIKSYWRKQNPYHAAQLDRINRSKKTKTKKNEYAQKQEHASKINETRGRKRENKDEICNS